MIPRATLVLIAFLSPFLFPWQLTLLIAAGASVILPPTALVVGVLIDALYWSYGSIPYATLVGLTITVVAYVVEGFIRTRIMDT
jgi:hypothetical protein